MESKQKPSQVASPEGSALLECPSFLTGLRVRRRGGSRAPAQVRVK
jgi:hypothetical protein